MDQSYQWMNGNTLLPDKDQGRDGVNGITRDAMARLMLCNGSHDEKPVQHCTMEILVIVLLRSVELPSVPRGYTYGYDQLNRLTKMQQHNLSNNTTVWSGVGNSKYQEDYSYDGNGNILSLKRNGPDGLLMDNLSYAYNLVNGKLQNNRLAALNDGVAGTSQEGEISGGAGSYGYDEIGNLTSDSREQIQAIDWNVYGKIRNITKNSGNIAYSYDPSGKRVSKTSAGLTTWYVRDAQGNSLGVYDNANGVINWREQQLYGSSRLGMWKPNFNLAKDSAGIKWNFSRLKFFELSNHLGNVLAVIEDEAPVVNGVNEAGVVSAQDYYPFGMIQPGRSFSSDSYRYGFNGKENDNEVKGDGNQQDYGMRIYDPRVGKFLSVDPITRAYSELTPYQFASNSPIKLIDIDGLEGGIPISYGDPEFKASLMKIIDDLELLHERGKVFVELAESSNATKGKKAGWMEKAGAYAIPYWYSLAPLLDANDGSVLLKGKNLDGKKASKVDYIAAGVGVLIPAVSGSALKKAIEGPLHHIFTNKNFIRGEQWSEKFVPLFEKAGYDLNDALNKVRVAGHRGPHPKAYHDAVYNRMIEATEGLSGKEYKEAFDKTIKELGEEAQKEGTKLNKLLTKPKEE